MTTTHSTESASYTAADSLLRAEQQERRPHGSAKEQHRKPRMPARTAMPRNVDGTRRDYGKRRTYAPGAALAAAQGRPFSTERPAAPARCSCRLPFPIQESARWTCANCDLLLPRAAWPVQY